MLTKTDLNQIRLLMREEITLMVKKEIIPLKKDVSGLKDEVNAMRKDLKSIVNVFDIEILDLRTRMLRVEKHLNLTS